MVKEIYIRTPEDPNFVQNTIDFSNEIESVITQIRVLLGTKTGQVFGAYDFGVDLDYLVFNTVQNANDVKKKIIEKITSYVHISHNITVDVEVNFGASGYGYDYAIVDIIINGRKAVGFLVDKE